MTGEALEQFRNWIKVRLQTENIDVYNTVAGCE
jgi:hypothetical protein